MTKLPYFLKICYDIILTGQLTKCNKSCSQTSVADIPINFYESVTFTKKGKVVAVVN
jgi:hypothetical protein